MSKKEQFLKLRNFHKFLFQEAAKDHFLSI